MEQLIRARITISVQADDEDEVLEKSAEFSLLELNQEYPDLTSDDFKSLMLEEATRASVRPVVQKDGDGYTIYPPGRILAVRLDANPEATQEGFDA